MTKSNCWEIKKCGREPGGAKSEELGVCIATTETSIDGINNGSNSGRICWAIAGTLCGGDVQGEFASKMDNCIKCEFYDLVEKEEEANFVRYPTSMARVNCWEFKNCGREPDGSKVDELGVCPAGEINDVDGVNRGRKGGRICWAVAGTLCGGKVQGEFATKIANCVTCDFYIKVLNEEQDFEMYVDPT